jgi:hypothetical protein
MSLGAFFVAIERATDQLDGISPDTTIEEGADGSRPGEGLLGWERSGDGEVG